MNKSRRRILPFDEWPDADANAWIATFESSNRYARRSSGSRLAIRTRRWLKLDYGNLLEFLCETNPPAFHKGPERRITSKLIERYVSWQQHSCRDSTVGMRLRNIAIILKHLTPEKDWKWLSCAAHQILSEAESRPKPLITSEELFIVGFRLMERARRNSAAMALPSKADCPLFRDGLMIVVLAVFFPRRRSLASLTIDKHVIRSGSRWVIEIPPEDMKSRRPHDLEADELLSSWIDEYLTRFRPRILGSEIHNGFWASRQSRPMAEISIWQAVTRRTQAELGFPVCPHRFRDGGITFLSRDSLSGLKAAQELAGHTSPITTEKYYRRARTESAGRAYAKAIGLQRKAVRDARKRTRYVQTP